MSATSIPRQERLARRVELVEKFGVAKLRQLYSAAVAKGTDRPIVCVFHASSGGGYNALKALASASDEGAWALPFDDVMQVATKCSMAGLVDVLGHRLQPNSFAVVCMAWDGWTLFYPDMSGGMDPKSYERDDTPPTIGEPPMSQPN